MLNLITISKEKESQGSISKLCLKRKIITSQYIVVGFLNISFTFKNVISDFDLNMVPQVLLNQFYS